MTKQIETQTLQNFLVLLRERNASLASHLSVECYEMMKDLIKDPEHDYTVWSLADDIMYNLDNYWPDLEPDDEFEYPEYPVIEYGNNTRLE